MTKVKTRNKPTLLIMKTRKSWNKQKTAILIAAGIAFIFGLFFFVVSEISSCQKSNSRTHDEKVRFKENILHEIADNCIRVQLYYASTGGLNTTKEVPWRPLRLLSTDFYTNNVGKMNLVENRGTKKAIHEVYEWFKTVSQKTDHLIIDEKWSNFRKIQNIKNDIEFLKEHGNKNRNVYKNAVDRCNETIKVLVDELRNEGPFIPMVYNVPQYKSDWYKEDILLKTMQEIATDKSLPEATAGTILIK